MIQPANLSSPLGVLQGIENPNVQHLTNEGMMIYLSTRLEGIDTQIDAIFQKQEKIEKVRDALSRFNNAVDKYSSETPNNDHVDGQPGWDAEINKILAEIQDIDPKLGAEMKEDLSAKDQILDNDIKGTTNGGYTTKEVENTLSYTKTVLKKLESSAQLEMIGLQSLMSSRQTAVQLSTNMVAAYGESLKAQVAKIG